MFLYRFIMRGRCNKHNVQVLCKCDNLMGSQDNCICNICLTVREVIFYSLLAIHHSLIQLKCRQSLMLLLCSPSCCACCSSLCIFKRRGLTFILAILSQTMGGYGGERGGGLGGPLGCGMKLGAVEGSHSWERRQRTAQAASHTHTSKTHREEEADLKGRGRSR